MTPTKPGINTIKDLGEGLQFESDPLGWLLYPFEKDEFVTVYLGVKHFVCKGNSSDKFGSLLSFDYLDEVTGTFGLRFPDIQVVRVDQDIPKDQYTWKDNLIDPMRVARLFAEGSTVIFTALHDRHSVIQRLCASLAERATAKTQANIYLTPPGAQGFKPHWDTHDVFILQVEGAKRWRIYEKGLEAPLATQKFDPDRDDAGSVVSEFKLEAGDLLYLPRGVMHSGVATDDVSLHITLGLITFSWTELLIDCISELSERDPTLRASLPFGFGCEVDSGLATLKRALDDCFNSLSRDVDLSAVLSTLLHQVDGAHRPRATDHLSQALRAQSVLQNARVRKRPGLHTRLERRNGRAVLFGGERELDFPVRAYQTLETVLTGKVLALGDVESELDWPGLRVVISTLIKEGIVETVS